MEGGRFVESERKQARDPGAALLAYKWVVLINTTAGILMASIDSSILTIALPDITRSIHATVAQVMWVVMGFQVVITALLLPISRLADIKGRVRPYILGFAIFTVASALCGFAQSGSELLVFRLIQGVGAAFIFANSTALVTDAFPSEERGFALGINMMAGVSGFILGTLLGGVITETLGWRYIFFINIPIGLFATTWAVLRLHETGELEGKARFDVPGMILFPLSITTVLIGLTEIVMGNAAHLSTKALIATGIAAFIMFVVVERHASFPMMDPSLFRIRLFLAGNVSLLLNAIARGSTMFILSWYFQTVLGNSPLSAGLKLLPDGLNHDAGCSDFRPALRSIWLTLVEHWRIDHYRHWADLDGQSASRCAVSLACVRPGRAWHRQRAVQLSQHECGHGERSAQPSRRGGGNAHAPQQHRTDHGHLYRHGHPLHGHVLSRTERVVYGDGQQQPA